MNKKNIYQAIPNTDKVQRPNSKRIVNGAKECNRLIRQIERLKLNLKE